MRDINGPILISCDHIGGCPAKLEIHDTAGESWEAMGERIEEVLSEHKWIATIRCTSTGLDLEFHYCRIHKKKRDE